jgi:hypothetical protein
VKRYTPEQYDIAIQRAQAAGDMEAVARMTQAKQALAASPAMAGQMPPGAPGGDFGIPPAAGAPSMLESFARGGAQGLTLGYSDEITGLVESLFTEKPYAQARDEARRNNAAAEAANPGTYLAGDLGSALIPGLGSLGAISRARSLSALPAAGRLAVGGAATGGVAGAGYSDADTPLGVAGDSALGGLTGAVAAPLVAGAISATGRLGSAAGDIVRSRLLDSPTAYAERRIANRLGEDDFVSAGEVRTELDRLGPEGRLADLGPNLRSDAELVVKGVPNAGKRVAEDFLETRQQGQQGRINERLTETLDPKWANYTQFLDDVTKGRRELSKPLYEAAERVPIQRTRVLTDLMKRPKVAEAWQKAEELMRNDVDVDLPLRPIGPGQFAQLQRYHYTLKALADKAQELKLSAPNEARIYTGLASALRKELFRQNPKFEQAQKMYSGATKLMEAAEYGRDIFKTRNILPDEVERGIANFADGEAEAFRIGVVRGIMDLVESKPLDRDSVRTLLPTRLQNIVRAAFPDEQSLGRFLDQLEIESQFSRTRNSVMSGSRTNMLQESTSVDLSMPLEVTASAASGSTTGFLMSVGRALSKAFGGNKKVTPEQAEAMGKILFDGVDDTTLRRIMSRRSLTSRGPQANLPPSRLTMGTGVAASNAIASGVVPTGLQEY